VFGEDYLGDFSYLILYLIISFGLYINSILQSKRLKLDTEKEIDDKYKQLEILTSLYASLNIHTPLPETGGWAAYPDFLKKNSRDHIIETP